MYFFQLEYIKCGYSTVADTLWNIGGGGAHGHAPQNIFKIRTPKMAFAAFWEHIL
jgi:hypothetical protein